MTSSETSLLGETAPADLIALRDGRSITRATMLAEAERLAAALPQAKVALNYCGDRYRFLCALVATLLRGQLTLLPQDRSSGTIAKLAAAHPGLYALCDGTERPANLPVVDVACDGTGSATLSVPRIELSQAAVTLFTSGSTGEPTPHTRDWRWLVAGARHYHEALLGGHGFMHIVGTVPPQHSFGLESTIMLPLLRPAAIVARTPFFAADIAAALEAAPAPRMLVTAPIHIQTLVRARARLPQLALILSATAPLAPDLAAAAEALYATELREVYGCSEIGLVATRRSTEGNVWQLPPDMRAVIDDEVATIEAPHLPLPTPLSDILKPIDARHFALAGRRADMINIAGKRASLAGLNAILTAIPGVEDGTFYVPEPGPSGTLRLVAVVVAPGRGVEAIRAELRARMDPAFVPRRVYVADVLPRDENGKLPQAALAELVRRFRSRRPT